VIAKDGANLLAPLLFYHVCTYVLASTYSLRYAARC
jgi:hypothetical protein